jgi:hypothetical protein
MVLLMANWDCFRVPIALTPIDPHCHGHQNILFWQMLDIPSRHGYGFAGLGLEQGRKVERIIGANTLRLGMAAARTLWCVAQPSHHQGIA